MHKDHPDKARMSGGHYGRLLIMAIVSFIAMYILMYAMVNSFDNVLNNINQFYMAGLMAAPMVPIEILLMSSMYPDKRRNALIIVLSVIAGLAFFFLIRQQGAVADRQFLRSMVPHHAGAILMCEQANLQDAEIQELCRTIISSQKQEIDQMKAKLAELEK